MKQLKFRAWDDGVMIYSDSFSCEQYVDYAWLCKFFESIRPDAIITEWTGLTDKNGINIYVGDFIKDSQETLVIEFGEYEFDGLYYYGIYSKMLDPNYKNFSSPLSMDDCSVIEIIGNIYQPKNDDRGTI